MKPTPTRKRSAFPVLKAAYIERLFGWPGEDVERTLRALVEGRKAISEVYVENSSGSWFMMGKGL